MSLPVVVPSNCPFELSLGVVPSFCPFLLSPSFVPFFCRFELSFSAHIVSSRTSCVTGALRHGRSSVSPRRPAARASLDCTDQGGRRGLLTRSSDTTAELKAWTKACVEDSLMVHLDTDTSSHASRAVSRDPAHDATRDAARDEQPSNPPEPGGMQAGVRLRTDARLPRQGYRPYLFMVLGVCKEASVYAGTCNGDLYRRPATGRRVTATCNGDV